MNRKISISAPSLSDLEEKNVLDAIRSTWISSTGPYVNAFEGRFASICGSRSAFSVCNGTVALHLALLALDVRPGDEVIVPSLTYVATANACRYVGAQPVFVEVDPETWCIDPRALEAAITPRTRGIIAVHLYGHPADMDAINHIAAVHGMWVIEDAAEAHMARYKGRPVGSLSRIATFSFYGNKVLTSGEGGALTLSDEALSVRVRTLRGQGVDPARRYYFPVVGYNFRLTNVACAILCAQLDRSDEIIRKRNWVSQTYRSMLADIPGLTFQPVAPWAECTPWLFSVLFEDDFGTSRDEVARILAAVGIETRPFFVPVHTLPPYREEAARRNTFLPLTENLAKRGMNLPTYPDLGAEELEFIATEIRKARG